MELYNYSGFKYNPKDYDDFDNYGFLGDDLRNLYNSKKKADEFPESKELYWKLKDNVFLVIGDLKGLKSVNSISPVFFDELREYVLGLLL